MSTFFVGMHMKSFRGFEPKHRCGLEVAQDGPSFIRKAVYGAVHLKEEDACIKKAKSEFQEQPERAEGLQDEFKDVIEAFDTLDDISSVSLEVRSEEKEAHLVQSPRDMLAVCDNIVQEQLKVEELESTCVNLESQCQQLREVKAAISRDRDTLKGLLGEVEMKLEQLQEDKTASERVVSLVFDELAEVRHTPEDDRFELQTEVVRLRKYITDLQARLEASTEAQVDISRQLDTVRHEFDSGRASYAILQEDFNALSTSYATLIDENRSLQCALSQAHLKVEHEMASNGEALTCLHLEREKTSELETRLVNSDLQGKELESKLMESTTLLAAAQQKIVDVKCELQSLKEHPPSLTHETSEVIFDAEILELELERDMYRDQEQVASAAYEVEKKLRRAIQAERDLYRELEQECLEAAKEQEVMRITAEDERDVLAAQLEAALAQNAQLSAQVQKEQDVNAVICSQLSTECDAHSNARDDLQALQTRLAATVTERDLFEHRLSAAGEELQAIRAVQHSLSTTNKALSRDLSEKNKYVQMLELQTRFQSATDEDAQALMADLAKENIALKASKKSVETALAGKVERCDVLEKELLRLRTTDASSSTPVSPASQVFVPTRAGFGDSKENIAPFSQTTAPPRSASLPFGNTSHFNASTTPPLKFPASRTEKRKSSSGFFTYFMKKNMTADLVDRDALDGATLGTDCPALS